MRPFLCLAWSILLLGSLAQAAQESSSSGLRLRLASSRQRQLCRDSLPRLREQLPQLVAVARVRQVVAQAGAPAMDLNSQSWRVSLQLGRVLQGDQRLVGQEIQARTQLTNATSACPKTLAPRPNETFIAFLEPPKTSAGANELPQPSYSLLKSVPMNLDNLERLQALVDADSGSLVDSANIGKRRQLIEDILCEARYCPYGRCKVLDETNGQTSCVCPTTCPPMGPQVCGSDRQSYPSECHLIQEGCRRQRPLFILNTGDCPSSSSSG